MEKKPARKTSHNLELNTSREHLIMPEYGRNMQKMVQHACTIEDKEQRNRVAHAIIAVMGQMYPHFRDVPEFKHKLWDHLFIMSDFKLEVDSPYPIPDRADIKMKPLPLPYPDGKIKFKHYGKIIEMMIEKAVDFNDGPLKDLLAETLANHMKKSYLTWNNKNIVDDSTILHDLEQLSKSHLKLNKSSNLKPSKDIVIRSPRKRNPDDRNDSGRFRRGGKH